MIVCIEDVIEWLIQLKSNVLMVIAIEQTVEMFSSDSKE